MGTFNPDHVHDLHAGVFPGLDRNYTNCAPGFCPPSRRNGFRRPYRIAEHHFLVHYPDGDQPANVFPYAAFRVRTFLFEGHSAERDQDPKHIQRHHSFRTIATYRIIAGGLETKPGPVANARSLRVTRGQF